jgi:hypothetical protein
MHSVLFSHVCNVYRILESRENKQDFWNIRKFCQSYRHLAIVAETHLTMMFPNEDVDGAVQVTVTDDLRMIVALTHPRDLKVKQQVKSINREQ